MERLATLFDYDTNSRTLDYYKDIAGLSPWWFMLNLLIHKCSRMLIAAQ